MRILVTSASGADGNGYGALLGFSPEGEFTGPFSSDPRIVDPRGMSLDPSGTLVYVNSGDDRILAMVAEWSSFSRPVSGPACSGGHVADQRVPR